MAGVFLMSQQVEAMMPSDFVENPFSLIISDPIELKIITLKSDLMILISSTIQEHKNNNTFDSFLSVADSKEGILKVINNDNPADFTIDELLRVLLNIGFEFNSILDVFNHIESMSIELKKGSNSLEEDTTIHQQNYEHNQQYKITVKFPSDDRPHKLTRVFVYDKVSKRFTDYRLNFVDECCVVDAEKWF